MSFLVFRVAAELENTSGYISFQVFGSDLDLKFLLNFQEFCFIMKDKDCGRDTETGYKEAFRLFSIQHFVQSKNLYLFIQHILFP